MAQYAGPVYQRMERDQSPELIASAGAAIGDGLAGLGKGIGEKLQANKNQREETDFVRGRYETLSKMAGQDPDDKFYGKSLGAQRAEVLGLEMSMQQHMNKPQLMTTPGGANVYYNPRTGAMTPQHQVEPVTVQNLENPNPGGPKVGLTSQGDVINYPKAPAPVAMGEWHDVPGVPGVQKHWTPTKGYTGAVMKIPETGSLPKLGYVENPNVPGVGVFIDPNGDVVDPSKLVTSEPIPGTEGPSKRMPMPFVPGMPPGIQFTVPGAPPQVRTRPYTPKDLPEDQKPQVIKDASGTTTRRWPDGREEYMTFDEKGVPSWKPMGNGPDSILLPPLGGIPGPDGGAAPAAPATVPPYRWRKP